MDQDNNQFNGQIEINLSCSNFVSYYNIQNNTSPIKRLYVKNKSGQDLENVRIRVFSAPDFLVPIEIEQELLSRKYNTRFDIDGKLSPLFVVALDKRIEGEIIVNVEQGDQVLAQARRPVQVLAFNECNFGEHIESIAGFVKRTHDINKLINQVNHKLDSWKVNARAIGYSGGKNAVRNYLAGCYSVLVDHDFVNRACDDDNQMISSHSEMLSSKILSGLELSVLLGAMIEGNGLNCIIGRARNKWYVGAFLTNECFANSVMDECSVVRKKMEQGVNDISMICVENIFGSVAFEKAEAAAIAEFKKSDDVDFFLDIKRARILRIAPLPERIKNESGYDLSGSEDFATEIAPKQIREYKGAVFGEKNVNRITQWERKLLELDMRNSLLNFKTNQTTCKFIVPAIETFVESIMSNRNYTLHSRPNDNVSALDKLNSSVENNSFLKPLADYMMYEYANKRLRVVSNGKDFENLLLRVYRKEKSMQEETGTMTLYIACGYLKWNLPDETESKYAPIFLFPVTLTKKGLSNTSYSIDINTEEAHINCTLLEFLYQEFNMDLRGLADVALDDSKSLLSVLARIKKEIVGFANWEIVENAFLATLSFSNYLLWYDVKYKSNRFKENPVVDSLMNNRLNEAIASSSMSDCSSDEAYIGKERILLPISADSSQYSAIKDSLSKSFVLHGPPGTGKSQTITNIIANNIVRGRRVLFVAEKMAALSVVRKRLLNIGIGDFCLELHSDKTDKIQVLNQIINTLNLSTNESEIIIEKAQEIESCITKLQSELDAMHRTRYLGFSLYDAILNYFENIDAPDCLRIDTLFFEKLTKTTFNNYLDVLVELSMRAKECGNIARSPFRRIGRFKYNELWRANGEAILEIYLMELKHLREYAKQMLPLFNMRTVALTKQKINALYFICKELNEDYAKKYFRNYRKMSNAQGLLDSFILAQKNYLLLQKDFIAEYKEYPRDIDIDSLKSAIDDNRYGRNIKRLFPETLNKDSRQSFLELLYKCEQTKNVLIKRTKELAELFEEKNYEIKTIAEYARKMNGLYESANLLYADCDINIFNQCCEELTKFDDRLYMQYYVSAYETCMRARQSYEQIFVTTSGGNEDISVIIDNIIELQKNIDFIPNWCKYQEIVDRCKEVGFEFILEPLSVGEITADDILRCFKKCVYNNFIRSELYLDDVLCQFSGLTLEETANKFKDLTEDYERYTRQELYQKLCASLPRTDTVGEHNLERVVLMRAEKTNMKGVTLRNLFTQIPNLLKATCPCMLMSPTSVSQFLDIDMEKFDLVVFDEASQVPTCKAIGSIVRGNNVIIVGDPKQLPPTSFFSAEYKDDEHLDVEDLESILDDCLSLGLAENHLLWHYRSNHESLIAFSNAMFYDNTLLTFPSPNEMSSKVTFQYVDGVYERGGSKSNKKEADVIINEVIARLQDPHLRNQSMGIVTFNTAQQNYIDNKLSKELYDRGLDTIAFDREEGLFVKNLENVQGDERDVILFSVGFGPDTNGKLSLNFGPLNQNGGYKRLNVAVTRARAEMKVFSAITGNMIDLNRTDSLGVKGLKAFLEYAERGREMLAVDSRNVGKNNRGIGALIASELRDRGIMCESNVGVSNFKIDVAVVDPRNKDKYLLAIICDSSNSLKLKGVKDRSSMQSKILRKLGWNTLFVWTVNYFNNSKREIAKIKDVIDTLTEKKVVSKKLIKEVQNKYKTAYKTANCKPLAKTGCDYVLNFVNEEKITAKIRDIISVESPIEEKAILEKICNIYGIIKTNKRAIGVLTGYMKTFDSLTETYDDKIFYCDKPIDKFRPNDTKVMREINKIHPLEIACVIKCVIESNLGVIREDICKEVIALLGGKKTKAVADWIEKAIDITLEQGIIFQTLDGTLTT